MAHLSSGGVIIGLGGKRLTLFPTAARFIYTEAYNTTPWTSIIRGELTTFKEVREDDPPLCPLSNTFEEIPKAAVFVRPAETTGNDRTEVSWCLLQYELPFPILPADILTMTFYPKIFGHRDIDPATNWATYSSYISYERPCRLFVFSWPVSVNTSYYSASSPEWTEKKWLAEVSLREVAMVDPFGPAPPTGLEIENSTYIFDTAYYPHRNQVPLAVLPFGDAPISRVTLAVMLEDLAYGALDTHRGEEKVCHIQTFDSPLFIDATEQERGANAFCLTKEAEELLLSWEYRTDGDLKAKPTSLEVALCVDVCTAETAGAECTDPGYARATLGVAAPTATGSGVPARGVYKNPGPLTFGTAVGNWSPIRSIAIFDDTGRYLFFANFPVGDSLEITDGIIPTIDTDGLWITTHLKFLQGLLTADALATVWPDFTDSPREFSCGFYDATGTVVHDTGDVIEFIPSPVLGDVRNSNVIVFTANRNATVTSFKIWRGWTENEELVRAVTPTHMGTFNVVIRGEYSFAPFQIRVLAEPEG